MSWLFISDQIPWKGCYGNSQAEREDELEGQSSNATVNFSEALEKRDLIRDTLRKAVMAGPLCCHWIRASPGKEQS